MQLELISIDLSNYCSKACEFCYNHSNVQGIVKWQPEELVSFALDCAANGVKAISLGGGEPFEYEGIFDVISALTTHLFVSITSNGLPLLSEDVFAKLIQNKPDKIHISIHNPEDAEELKRTLFLVKKISKHNIKSGINILVSGNRVAQARIATKWLYHHGISAQQIIFIPRKGTYQPTAKAMADVAGTNCFQSTFCLTECKPSQRFCSISYDKSVNFCSYSDSKIKIKTLNYSGLVTALGLIKFKKCQL